MAIILSSPGYQRSRYNLEQETTAKINDNSTEEQMDEESYMKYATSNEILSRDENAHFIKNYIGVHFVMIWVVVLYFVMVSVMDFLIWTFD